MKPLYEMERRKKRERNLVKQVRRAGKLRRRHERDDSVREVWPMFSIQEVEQIVDQLKVAGIELPQGRAMGAGGNS